MKDYPWLKHTAGRRVDKGGLIVGKTPRKRMTKKEREAWDSLYEYVRTKVMRYDSNQALPSQMVLRLKGMLNGKFMANGSTKDMANYSYDVVLNTFKYSMPDIQRALNSVPFKDESHKFNYIMKIVERNLNDVYMRMKGAERAKEEMLRDDSCSVSHKAVEYKPKKKNKDKFSDLW